MNIQSTIKQHQLTLLFQQGRYGLEKESQRIWQNGELATTSHPSVFGNRRFHPYIQTDFAESQLELITPPNTSIKDTMRWLSAIHQIVLRNLPVDEYIFPFSMPPYLPDDNQIQVAKLDDPADVAYRQRLVARYGKKKQMVSGIHYNFQLSTEFIRELHSVIGQGQTLVEFQNQLYLKMTRNFLRYQWILVYLLAATPTVDASYFHNESPLKAGQQVEIGLKEKSFILASFLLYGIPLFMLIMTTIISQFWFKNELIRVAIIVACTGFCFFLVKLLANKLQKLPAYQPILLRVYT